LDVKLPNNIVGNEKDNGFILVKCGLVPGGMVYHLLYSGIYLLVEPVYWLCNSKILSMTKIETHQMPVKYWVRIEDLFIR